MATAQQILEDYGVAVDDELQHYESDSDDDASAYARVRAMLLKKLDAVLTPVATGGADWSVAHAWAIPPWLANEMFRNLPRDGKLFVTWNEGDLDDQLSVDLQTVEDGSFGVEEFMDFDASMLMRMERLSEARRR